MKHTFIFSLVFQRPFVCEYQGCKKAFIRAYHLKRHTLSHVEKKLEFR